MHFKYSVYFGKGKIKKLSRKAIRRTGKFFYGVFSERRHIRRDDRRDFFTGCGAIGLPAAEFFAADQTEVDFARARSRLPYLLFVLPACGRAIFAPRFRRDEDGFTGRAYFFSTQCLIAELFPSRGGGARGRAVFLPRISSDERLAAMRAHFTARFGSCQPRV